MYKIYFIAKNNMKKQKGDLITFFILTFVAAFLIFDCISAILGMGKVQDKCFKEINGPEVILCVADRDGLKDAADKTFREDSHIQGYEASPIVNAVARYRNTKNKDFEEYQFFIEAYEAERTYLDLKVDVDSFGENDVLVPYYTSGRFKVGDTFQFEFDGTTYDLRVAGFIENPYMSSALNISIFHIYTSQKMMDKIADEQYGNSVARFMMYKGKTDPRTMGDGFTTADLEKEIGDKYKENVAPYAKENPDADVTNYMLLNWDTMRTGAEILPIIVMGVLLLFSVIILLVAFLIISFSIRNFIQRNMKNTGILEASGYTIKELRRAISLEMIIVSGLGAVFGTVVGAITFGFFGNIVSSILGHKWNQPINIAYAAFTAVGLVFLVWLISKLISRTYKKITVLSALRGGLGAHNFKKNHFSFEKTKLPLPVVLSLKDTFGNLGRNIAMVIMIAILSIAMLCGFGMLENFGTNPDRMLKITGTTTGKIMVQNSRNNLTDEIWKIDGVTEILTYQNLEPEISKGNKTMSANTFAMIDPEKNYKATILDGRMPKQANELMVTAAVADEMGISCGDVVKLTFAGTTEEYLITGINQRMQEMGRTMVMTIEGAAKLLPGAARYTYEIDAKDNVTYEYLKAEIGKIGKAYDEKLSYQDFEKLVDESMGAIMTSMKAICIVFSVITLLIVFFVESLVIRAKIVREWRGMGISKALGMTSKGLISQIMISNIPAILGGILIGTVIAPFAGLGIVKIIFMSFGIKEIDFDISIIAMLITGVSILVVALLTSGLFGRKVRRLQPVEMITEE